MNEPRPMTHNEAIQFIENRPRLSEQQKADYLARNGWDCPNCGDNNVDGEPCEDRGTTRVWTNWCLNCGCQWRDVFTFTAVEQV